LNPLSIQIAYPDWVAGAVDWDCAYQRDTEMMTLAIRMARLNVEHATGGPFGAAIFEEGGGRLVAVGMNLVVPNNNCVLHGEMVAIMMAQARLGTYSLGRRGMPGHVLATSCEPCAMCLGAAQWSGVRRVISGATREDAEQLGFDEGPVFPESYAYLEARGLTFDHAVLRDEAAAALRLYFEKGGRIYNG
jgi:tRNA(Arg) A34 adenosine deaminase TadA